MMEGSGGLLWLKVLGLVGAGLAFAIWQWRDLRVARAESEKRQSKSSGEPEQ